MEHSVNHAVSNQSCRLDMWLRAAAARLRAADCDAPRTDAELLAVHLLGGDRLRLRLTGNQELSSSQVEALNHLAHRREQGEPLAYILGEREFYGRSFRVTPATLIPRPETEHLIEAALSLCPASRLRFADCGTGSGCVAVTLAAERPGWHGLATDISSDALAVARANAAAHHVADRLHFVRADMSCPMVAPASLDLIVSNPPYVSRPEYDELSREVLCEPLQALIPVSLSPDSPYGLECLEALIRHAAEALVSGGWLCLEHGWTQAEALKVCFFSNTWKNIHVFKDLSGKNRITVAQRL